MSFNGKKVVITGAGREFGQTLTIIFAKLGAELFISARSVEKADESAEMIKELVPSAQVSTFGVDVTKAEQIVEFSKGVEQVTDAIDILINNASYWLEGDIYEVTDEDIVESVNSTATGSILMTKHFMPLLKRSNSPDIVFINSTAGLPQNTSPGINDAFSAAKASQAAFADGLRHRSKGTGIRVITIYPPNFDNTSPLNETEWNERRDHTEWRYLTTRNVAECVQFALNQDRICSIDKIVLGNNNPSSTGVL